MKRLNTIAVPWLHRLPAILFLAMFTGVMTEVLPMSPYEPTFNVRPGRGMYIVRIPGSKDWVLKPRTIDEPYPDHAVGKVRYERWVDYRRGLILPTLALEQRKLLYDIYSGYEIEIDEEELRARYAAKWRNLPVATRRSIKGIHGPDCVIKHWLWWGTLGNGLLGLGILLLGVKAHERWQASSVRVDYILLQKGACPQCLYSIRGLTEPRCPECGTSWPPQWVPKRCRPGSPVVRPSTRGDGSVIMGSPRPELADSLVRSGD